MTSASDAALASWRRAARSRRPPRHTPARTTDIVDGRLGRVSGLCPNHPRHQACTPQVSPTDPGCAARYCRILYNAKYAACRPLRVKFILPALTEATSPFWRPIKYSLFPPLGLATLAAYLDAGRRGGRSWTSTSSRSTLDDAPGPRRDPGLHHQRLPRLPHRRPLPRARRVRRARRPARHVAARRGRARTPTRSSSAPASRRFRSSSRTSAPGAPQRALRVDRRAARSTRCRRSAAT